MELSVDRFNFYIQWVVDLMKSQKLPHPLTLTLLYYACPAQLNKEAECLHPLWVHSACSLTGQVYFTYKFEGVEFTEFSSGGRSKAGFPREQPFPRTPPHLHCDTVDLTPVAQLPGGLLLFPVGAIIYSILLWVFVHVLHDNSISFQWPCLYPFVPKKRCWHLNKFKLKIGLIIM